jgi:predicted ester cyclase
MEKLHLRFISTISLISLIFLTQGCQDQAKKNEFDNLKTTIETQNRNKEIARELFASIDKNDFDKLTELLSDDFSLSAPGLQQPWKKDELFQAIKTFYASFPDWTHMINELIAEGDKVVIKLACKGTQKAQYENISPTGKIVTQDAMNIIKIVNGKVKESWILEDNLGLMVQLGMELKPTDKKK